MSTLRNWVAGAAVLTLGVLASTAANASAQASSSSAIASVTTFTEFGSTANGDIVFQLTSSGLAPCTFGFWIRGSDIGAKNTLAQLLAAYHTGKPVIVTADTDNSARWPGNSNSQACLVLFVQS